MVYKGIPDEKNQFVYTSVFGFDNTLKIYDVWKFVSLDFKAKCLVYSFKDYGDRVKITRLCIAFCILLKAGAQV